MGDAVLAPGAVVVAIADVGQLVSEPTGTSEYWKANCAVPAGNTETAAGGALAAGDRLTVSPSTTVTTSGAPLPENSAIRG